MLSKINAQVRAVGHLRTAGNLWRSGCAAAADKLEKIQLSSVILLDKLNREKGREELAIAARDWYLHTKRHTKESLIFFGKQSKVFVYEIAAVIKSDVDAHRTGRVLTYTELMRKERVTADIRLALLAAPFVIIPFGELALVPFYKKFPSCIPSNYRDPNELLDEYDVARRRFMVTAEALTANFRKMALYSSENENNLTADERMALSSVLHALEKKSHLSSRDVVALSRVYGHFKLEKMSTAELVVVAEALGVGGINATSGGVGLRGDNNDLMQVGLAQAVESETKHQLINSIRRRYRVLQKMNERMSSKLAGMTLEEMQSACKVRGIVVASVSTDDEMSRLRTEKLYRRRLEGYDRMCRNNVPIVMFALVTAHNNNIVPFIESIAKL